MDDWVERCPVDSIVIGKRRLINMVKLTQRYLDEVSYL